MRALPILAAILCTGPLAKGATSQLDLLQSRCQEYERQIRQLEEENTHLKSLVGTASKTPATQEAPLAKKEEKAAPQAQAKATEKEKESTDSYGIVRNGDTLVKLAKRHGTTPEALAKLNNLKKPYLIRAGQRMRLPEGKTEASAVASAPAAKSEVAAVAEASTKQNQTPVAMTRGKHTVKAGETFFSIARHYRLGAEALQAANPNVKATALRVGQTLNIEKPADTPAPITKPSSSKPKMASTKPAAESPKAPAPAPKLTAEKSSAHTHSETAKTSEAPKPAETAAKTESSESSSPAPAAASNTPRIHTIAIEENTDLADFAAAHGTSIAKLNALNGLNLNSSTVLAKGSELYVPAQP